MLSLLSLQLAHLNTHPSWAQHVLACPLLIRLAFRLFQEGQLTGVILVYTAMTVQ